MGDGGGRHWLVRMECRTAGWSVCLLLLIFPCSIKSKSSLLAPAYLGSPGKRAVKWLCVCVSNIYLFSVMMIMMGSYLSVVLQWLLRACRWLDKDHHLRLIIIIIIIIIIVSVTDRLRRYQRTWSSASLNAAASVRSNYSEACNRGVKVGEWDPEVGWLVGV